MHVLESVEPNLHIVSVEPLCNETKTSWKHYVPRRFCGVLQFEFRKIVDLIARKIGLTK